MVDPAPADRSSVAIPPNDPPALSPTSSSDASDDTGAPMGAVSPLAVSPMIQAQSPAPPALDSSADMSATDTAAYAPNLDGPDLLGGDADADLAELSSQGLIEITEVKHEPEPPPVIAQEPSIEEYDELKAVKQAAQQEPAEEVTATNSVSDSASPAPVTTASTNPSAVSPKATTQAPQAKTPAGPAKPVQSVLDVLVNRGAVSQDVANQILTQSVQKGSNVDAILSSWPDIREEDLAQARAEFYHIPYVNLSEIGVFPEALSQVPENIARHYWLLPFAVNKDDKTMSVAMNNPLDVTAVDFLQQKTGLRVIPHYASPSEIERLVGEQYAQNLSGEVDKAVEQNQAIKDQRKAQRDFSELSQGGTIRQAPITKIVQTILALALKSRASDIHIEPQENRTRVRYRIDGILQERLILPQTVHGAVVSRVKILAGLKIDERRLPQDGRFDFEDDGHEIDLRISTLPTIHGEKVVMRLLQKNAQVPTLPDLGLNGLALRHVQDSIKVPHGIVLITGPTGSGKTTTLYSILHTINTPKVNIVTLEDPVEYMMLGVNQVQVNPQAGLTFASGLRSFLRQDPNIIMVGEIRDSETAGLAIQASLTGHLVFSTLHTSSAATAIPRLMDMEAEPFLLASSMTCVIAQRIARVLHPDYKESYKPEPSVLEDIKKVLGVHFERWLAKRDMTEDDVVLYRPKKERPETEPEYLGRIAIFEVMRVTEEMGKLVLDRKPAPELEKLAINDGMLLMKQDGYIKVLEGITTIEEILRVAEI